MNGTGWAKAEERSDEAVPTRGHARPSARLAVSLQEVVPGQAEAADGWTLGQASMGPMPIVTMEPDWELLATLI